MRRNRKLSFEERLQMIKEYLEDNVILTLLSKKYIYYKSKVELMTSRFKRYGEYELKEVGFRKRSLKKNIYLKEKYTI